jgi:PKD repeat protein
LVKTRLRVVMSYGSPVADACSGGGFGETEDYPIEIIPSGPICNPLVIFAQPSVSGCGSATASVTNPPAGATFQWSNGGTGSSITVSTAGAYSVVLTTAEGCVYSDTIEVVINSASVNLGINPTICPGQSATLDAANPGATYLWSTGATTQTISVDAAGSYSVTITAANGCTAADTVVVAVVSDANLSLNVPAEVNEDAAVTLTAAGADSYSWSLPSGAPSTAAGASVTVTYATPGTQTVTLTATISGCTFTRTAQIVVKPVVSRTENALTTAFNCWPNPVSDILHVEVAYQHPQAATLVVTDLTGRTLWTQAYEPSTTLRTEVPVNGLSAGLYTLTVLTPEGFNATRFTVK